MAINHPSICNFVRVAAEVYGIQLRDRVYQGMTIAFDFSVEEIWVPWVVGATLVPKPGGSSLLGMDLHEFLIARWHKPGRWFLNVYGPTEQDPNGGMPLPAAVIMEMVQGEGGVIPARREFVQRGRALSGMGLPVAIILYDARLDV